MRYHNYVKHGKKERVSMAPKVFVSFDYDHDKRYKFLLEAWNKNHRFDFSFDDHSSREILSSDFARVKGALTTKIRAAECTLVIVGEYANALHRHSAQIGYRNWINFEVAKSVECGNKIVAVKLSRNNASPEKLLGVNAEWVHGFNPEDIATAINNVTSLYARLFR